MSSEQPVGTSPLGTPSDRLVGRVKWFNNKAGYGFITVTDGDRAGSDIFAHHSGVMVGSEQYKYLVQGEYVSFKLAHTPGAAHEYQAGDVSGINGGKLMCETRREFRETRATYSKSPDETPRPRSSRPPQADATPRARGSGPREGAEWTMVVKGSTKPQDTPTPVAAGRGGAGRGSGSGRGRGRPPRVPKVDA